MKNLKDKTAFITGGAEGIGFEIARSFARKGMNVMLADIDSKQLDQAITRLEDEGFNVAGVVCDVALKADLEKAALKTVEAFEKIHIAVSNAGVSVIGSQKHVTENDWRWIIDVNLMSVVYVGQVFAPLIQSHGEGGHIINVASMAGMKGIEFAGPYCATKAAVISLSESWLEELNPDNIGVSVLCPAFVKSRIYDSKRNRQERYGGPLYFEDLVKAKPHYMNQKEIVMNGIDTHIVGDRVVEAVERDEFYIFTHPASKDVVNNRYEKISSAFTQADDSPALKNS